MLLRAGLARLLEDDGIEVVDAVGDAETLLRHTDELGDRGTLPDLAIVDVRMPPTHSDEGLRAALVLRRRWPQLRILVLSQYVEERYATELIADETRGVGYLLKDRVADVGTFLEALRRVADGGTALDPEVVSQLLARSRRADPIASLTGREREVLALMAQGRSNAGIATALVVSGGAVEKHIANIFAKLGLESVSNDHRRVLAVLRYIDAGPEASS
ncbi:MAG: LuxR C-terminal-related transcriptional regulator [Frankia sp.]